MANKNNCYFNAAFTGFVSGILSGRRIVSVTPAAYAGIRAAALAFAGQVDLAIPFDALVTTSNVDPTMLVSSNQTIQSNTILRNQLLQSICAGVANGGYTEDAVAADYTGLANAVAAAFTEAVAGLVSP